MKDGDWFGKWIVSFFNEVIHFSSHKTTIKIYSDGKYSIEKNKMKKMEKWLLRKVYGCPICYELVKEEELKDHMDKGGCPKRYQDYKEIRICICPICGEEHWNAETHCRKCKVRLYFEVEK